jgi:hypothetical protein
MAIMSKGLSIETYEESTGESTGESTITSGNTSVTINHGLQSTPTYVSAQPIDEYGVDSYIPEASITSTQFQITIQVPQPSDAKFKWNAKK